MKLHELEAWAKKLNMEMLPKEHPIYSEGPSITFHSTSASINTRQIQTNSLETFLEEHPPGSELIVFEVCERGRLQFPSDGEESRQEVDEKPCVDTECDEEIDDQCTEYDPPLPDSAFLFWQDCGLDPSEFGIVLIEGDCPGSDYIAAELRESIEFANATAVRLGVPVRFI